MFIYFLFVARRDKLTEVEAIIFKLMHRDQMHRASSTSAFLRIFFLYSLTLLSFLRLNIFSSEVAFQVQTTDVSMAILLQLFMFASSIVISPKKSQVVLNMT